MLLSILAGLLTVPAADTLQAVTVLADRGIVVSRTDTVLVNPGVDAAGTLLKIPSLYVGDYGYGAGLKSVSLRGLGSAHTAIYVDGVRLGNIQSGQNDLGMVEVRNLASAVVDYAQNSISFNTAKPVFGEGRRTAGHFRLDAGSFGTWQPFGRMDFRLSDKVSFSANVAANYSDGDYPLAGDTKRANNDIKQIRGGADAWGVIKQGDWHAKLYLNGSDRGTPGSLSWPSEDRQNDRNYLLQGTMSKHFGEKYELQFSAKGSYDDLSYKSSWGDSDYKQTEFQLSTMDKYHLLQWWTISFAVNLQWDGIKGSVYEGSRTSALFAAASAIRTGRFKADLALEHWSAIEEDGGNWESLSPSADLRLTLLPGLDITAFGRRAYRVPTFNELYYPGYGNADLKPEDAWLTDVGLDFGRTFGRWIIKARADGFYNYLTDKIISAPSEDPMIWLPYNVGKVKSHGADLYAESIYKAPEWMAGVSARYGYQKALDKTPDSYTFNQQLPYIARNSLVLAAEGEWKGWSLEAVYNLRSGRRDGTGEMPDWRTLDISAGKQFRLQGGMTLGLNIHARNLTDCRYDIIRDYPMPGRSLLAGLEFRF